MKKLIITSIILTFTITAFAQQYTVRLNEFNVYLNGKVTPRASLTTHYKINNKLTHTTYFYASQSWGEGLTGFTYQLTDWLKIGYIAGIQTSEKSMLRGSPIFGFKSGKYSANGFFEHGGDYYRWKVKCFYNCPQIRYGFEGIRVNDLYAYGPRLEVKLFKSPFYLWGSALKIESNDDSDDPYAGQVGLYLLLKS